MARYYCEYCHSYLTHDTLSVRKSHLVGKNHLRIVADYYRNKSISHEHKERARGKKRTPGCVKSIAIHCLKNSEKKQRVGVSKTQKKELLNKVDILREVYAGSPGYNKVFIESNRFDIGDLVRSTRMPRRANERVDVKEDIEDNSREVLYGGRGSGVSIGPPMILSEWSSTLPRTSVYWNESLLYSIVTDCKRRIDRGIKRMRSD